MPSRKPTRFWVGRFAPVLGLIGLMLAGCDEPVSENATPISAPTAEERFERLIGVLRQSVEGRAITDASAVKDFNAAPGVPVTNGKLRVEEELIPPSQEGEPYKAVICLSTKSTVMVVLPETDEADKSKDRAETKARVDDAKEGLEGVPDMESLVVPNADAVRRSLASSPIHSIESDESKSCYQLEFRDGRWEQVQGPEEDDEFFSLAIEYALKMQ